MTGWTWEYIDDHITLPRLYAMLAYLRKWPPVYKLVAAYLDYKEPGVKEVSDKDNNDVAAEFLAAVAAVNGASSGGQ